MVGYLPELLGASSVAADMATLFPGSSIGSAPTKRSGASTRINFLNACLSRAWQAGAAQVPSLEPAAILSKARRKSGVGTATLPDNWLDRLERLTDDLTSHAELTPLGRTIAHGQLVSASANMLGMRRLCERHPQIEEQRILRPIIIVGQMRSGTTRMQRLLACDARFRFTRFQESWNPLPLAATARFFDDRPWRARTALMAARLLNPQFQAIHPTSALAPDEEIGFFNMLMVPAAYEAQWRLPRFVQHCEAMDSAPIYLDFKRILKTIAWLRGGRDERPWILKVPQFGEDLDALLAAFPDARIIHVVRDRNAVVASSASLVSNQMALQSDRVDPQQVGREWSRKVRLRADRTARALAETELPQIEVGYDEMDHDWRGEMARVYEILELPVTEDVERKMGEYLRKSGAANHQHHYDPADFGLSVPGQHLEEAVRPIRRKLIEAKRKVGDRTGAPAL